MNSACKLSKITYPGRMEDADLYQRNMVSATPLLKDGSNFTKSTEKMACLNAKEVMMVNSKSMS